MSDGQSVGSEFPKELVRCQELVDAYKAMPNGAGAFGAALIANDIALAVAAIASQDVVAMVRAYKALKESE